MNQKEKQRVYQYNCCKNHTLYDLYKNPSDEKIRIYKRLLGTIPKECWDSVRVWGSCFQFTFAYKPEPNKITFITSCSEVTVDLDKEEDICL